MVQIYHYNSPPDNDGNLSWSTSDELPKYADRPDDGSCHTDYFKPNPEVHGLETNILREGMSMVCPDKGVLRNFTDYKNFIDLSAKVGSRFACHDGAMPHTRSFLCLFNRCGLPPIDSSIKALPFSWRSACISRICLCVSQSNLATLTTCGKPTAQQRTFRSRQ